MGSTFLAFNDASFAAVRQPAAALPVQRHLSLRERRARPIPSGVSAEAKVFALSKSGGSRTPGTGSQVFIGCQLTWRPARRFLTKVLQFLSAVGSPKPDLACQSRAGLLPIRFQPHGGPAVVRGGAVTTTMIELFTSAGRLIPGFISATSFDHLVGAGEEFPGGRSGVIERVGRSLRHMVRDLAKRRGSLGALVS